MTRPCEHPFAIYLAGAEAPYWRSRLTEGGARHVAVNFLQLRKERMPKSGLWDVAEKFPDEVEVLADGGGHSAARAQVDHEDHLAAYIRWAALNVNRLTLIVEYDPGDVDLDWLLERRERYEGFGAAFVPAWHEEHGVAELEALCQVYERVAITSPSAATAARLRALVARTGVKLHGLAITGPDDLQHLPLATATSTSWISPTKYGETQVWAGGRFHWYPASSRDTARRRHAHDIDQAGFDAAAYVDGDRKEVARYSVWAWAALEDSIARQRSAPEGLIVDLKDRLDRKETCSNGESSVDHNGAEARSGALVASRERLPFPGLRHREVEVPAEQGERGAGEPATVILPGLTEAGLRRCASCSLATRCPAFDPSAACAYRFGTEIGNKAQLDAALASVLESEFRRLSFALANEEADGVVLNLDVSAELERFLKMTERIRDIQSDTSLFRVEARGSAAGGIISALLAGAGAGQGAPPPRAPAVPVNPGRVEEILGDVIDIDPEEE